MSRDDERSERRVSFFRTEGAPALEDRITSYNVCYTKLLRLGYNAARHAHGELPEPIVVLNHGEAMGSRFHARVALLYAIEKACRQPGADHRRDA